MRTRPRLSFDKARKPPLDAVAQQAAPPAPLTYPIPEEGLVDCGGSCMPPLIGTYSPPAPYGLEPQVLIAWCPPGVEPELAGVMVPKGSSLEPGDWWMALADRVQQMVDKEPDPDEAATWAAKALGRPGLRDSRDAGEVLVERNLELRNALTLDVTGQPKDPFPALANEESEDVRAAMAETDLELWINLAEPRMR
jgi:hypothetical protein